MPCRDGVSCGEGTDYKSSIGVRKEIVHYFVIKFREAFFSVEKMPGTQSIL